MKRTPIKRKTPMKRGGWLRRVTRLRSRSKKRAKEEQEYEFQKPLWLSEHPQCQVTVNGKRCQIHFEQGTPTTGWVHHRMGREGKYLLMKRWWMTVCPDHHEMIENYRLWAYSVGYLKKRI